MSDGTAANWFPDPYARHQLRYWDGGQWTEHVSDQGVAGVDPLTVAQAPPVVTAPIVAPTADQTTMISVPSSAAGLPPGGAPAANSSARFPVVPLVAGLVVAALVVGGLVVFLGGGDDDDTATVRGELTQDNPVGFRTIGLDAGEGIRYRAIPRSNDEQDLVIVLAMSENDSLATLREVIPDSNWVFSDIASDDVLSDIFSDQDQPEDFEVGEGEYVTLFESDDGSDGDAEGDVFVAPVASTVRLFVYDFDGALGEYDLEIEKWSGRLDIEGTDYFDEFSGLLSDNDDDFFASDAPFFDILSDAFTDFEETS